MRRWEWWLGIIAVLLMLYGVIWQVAALRHDEKQRSVPPCPTVACASSP